MCPGDKRPQSVSCYRRQNHTASHSAKYSVIHQLVYLTQWQWSNKDSLWYLYNALSFTKHFPVLSCDLGCHNNAVKPKGQDHPENQTLRSEVIAKGTSREAKSQTLGSWLMAETLRRLTAHALFLGWHPGLANWKILNLLIMWPLASISSPRKWE